MAFAQPTPLSAALNRDVSGSGSIINGTLTANGRVYILNTAGVTLGSNAVIATAAFAISTLDVSDSDFLNGFPSSVVHLAGWGDGITVLDGAKIVASQHVVLVGNGVTLGTPTGGGAAISAPYIGIASSAGGTVDIGLALTLPTINGTTLGNIHLLSVTNANDVQIQGNTILSAQQGNLAGGQMDISAQNIEVAWHNLLTTSTLDASSHASVGAGGNINLYATVDVRCSTLLGPAHFFANGTGGGLGGNIIVFAGHAFQLSLAGVIQAEPLGTIEIAYQNDNFTNLGTIQAGTVGQISHQ